MILLRFIYWLFEKHFNKIYFSKQSKKKTFDGMTKAFVDSNGVAYYTWKDDFEIPISRMQLILEVITLIKSGLSEDNLKIIIEEMRFAINKGKNPDIVRLGFIVEEMDQRRNKIISMDSLYMLTALTYVREDEDLVEVKNSILEEKIEQFKKDSKDGLYDFFYSLGILDHIPYIEKSPSEWNTYFQECDRKIRAMNEYLLSTTKRKL